LVTSDWENTQLYVIDFQWLGVGRIRYGIYNQGVIRYCHEILNSGNTEPFMKLAKLPVRFEIRSDAVAAAGEMRMISAAVISEGGNQPIGNTWAYTSPATATANQVFAMRLKASANRMSALITNVSMTPTGGNDYIAWEVIRIPDADYTPSGGWVDSGSPGVEYNIGGAVVTTNQAKIWGEVAQGKGQASSAIESRFVSFPLVSAIDGTSFVYVVHAVQTASEAVGIAVNWSEFR